MKLTAELLKHRNELGIVSGQMRAREYIHNGGWYNVRGEKIGWGDLSTDDLEHIAEVMKGNSEEVFVVLSEQASFWNFVSSFGFTGASCETDGTEQNPGINYVANHARYAITGDGLFFIHNEEEIENWKTDFTKPMSREVLRQLLENKNEQNPFRYN